MSETRIIAAILVADVVGYGRLAGADEDRTLARHQGLRNDLIAPSTPCIMAALSSARERGRRRWRRHQTW